MSDEKVSNETLFALMLQQGKTLEEIRTDVKAQNGRVANHETRLSVLEDRGGRDNTARATGIGSLVGGALYAVYQIIGGAK